MMQIITFTSSLKKIQQIKQKRSRRLRPKTSMMFYTVRQVCSSSLDLMTASILSIFFRELTILGYSNPCHVEKPKRLKSIDFL